METRTHRRGAVSTSRKLARIGHHPLSILLLIGVAVLAGACTSGPKGGDLDAWCGAYQQLRDIDASAEDPAELKANVAQLRTATQEVVRTAPNDVKEPSAVMGQRFPAYLDEVEAADYDISKVDVDAFFSGSAIAEAGQSLDGFFDEHCEES